MILHSPQPMQDQELSLKDPFPGCCLASSLQKVSNWTDQVAMINTKL